MLLLCPPFSGIFSFCGPHFYPHLLDVYLLICSAHSISDDRGYLSIRAGMWAGYELSVTRALGHKHLSEYGVLCEPTVNTMQLQPADACLVSCPGDMS